MKLQSASQKEIRRSSKGALICDALLIAVLFLLSQFDIGTFRLLPILLGVAGGTVVAIANFTILCLTVQKAVDIEDKKAMKARFQLSYNLRLFLQAGWVVLCLVLPQIHFIAGAAPVLFPNAVIFYLQRTNKLVTNPENPAPKVMDDEQEDHLESFEI